ncbi:MAG: efflux RND transporter permease subunit [Clostridia bacterium]|nr:efflux RND transporter permease subunit [Deltaproteobacteria bacterium]
MIRGALRNPIAVAMACIGIIVFACVVAPRLAVDTFPELAPPVLVVGTQAPGMGPQDVEKTLSWRFEKFVSATPGVDHVESVSRAGLSIVYVWLKWGTDLNAAQTLVQQQVQFAMSSVPKSLGVIPPFVLQYDPSNAPVIQVAVYGGGMTGPQLYDYAQNTVEPILEGIPGVASASPNGGRERQINVIVDPIAAEARGLTSTDIAQVVNQSNALLPSGRFIVPTFDANVYSNAVPERVRDIGDASVKIVDGAPVYVHDVAQVRDAGAPETQSVAIDGQDGVYLNILRVPGGNVISIVDAVKARIAELDLPGGLHVEPIFDQSTFVRTTYAGLKREIAQAMVLVALVILLFLQSARSVAVAAIAVPIAFAVILIVLYVTGQTLNAFTLGGLTLALGPLVDISVVVLESVHRQRAEGKSAAQAALDGTRAVAVPALAATLATVAVLLPVVLLEGLAKKLFVPLALTVATAMFAGYVISMLVTPVACRYLLGHATKGRLAIRLEHAIDRVAAGYARALEFVLQHRLWLGGAIAVLVIASAGVAVTMPTTFFPEIDESMERIYVRFTPGTSLENASKKMEAMAQLIRDKLSKDSIRLIVTNVGAPGKARSAMNSPNAGPHMGFIRVALNDPEEREASQREVSDQIRALLTSAFPGVELLQTPGGLVASVFLNGYLAPMMIELRGDDLTTLAAQARSVAEVARGVAGIRDITVSLETEYPEVRIETDRSQAGFVGVNVRAAAQTMLEATLGNINTPGVWVDQRNGQSYYVVTSYDGTEVDDPSALARIPVRASMDGSVSLGSYGRVFRTVGPIAIERNALTRVARIMMQTEGRDIGSSASELEDKLASEPATRDIDIRFVGQVDLMRTTFSGLGVAVGLAIMVVFMVMATQFKSVVLPFAMLFTIPAALIGIVLALLAAGLGFSITALMGVLMVIGIAVSNGILLVDHANRRFQEGMEKVEAVLDAARVRFVPIAMTSLATIIGLLPVALALEHGGEANRPLALAVVGGLTSSTCLSLFLVPVMFTVLARRAKPEE